MISEKRSNPVTNSGFGISHSPTVDQQRPLPIKKEKPHKAKMLPGKQLPVHVSDEMQ